MEVKKETDETLDHATWNYTFHQNKKQVVACERPVPHINKLIFGLRKR